MCMPQRIWVRHNVLYVRHNVLYVRHNVIYVCHNILYVRHNVLYVRHNVLYVRHNIGNNSPLRLWFLVLARHVNQQNQTCTRGQRHLTVSDDNYYHIFLREKKNYSAMWNKFLMVSVEVFAWQGLKEVTCRRKENILFTAFSVVILIILTYQHHHFS